MNIGTSKWATFALILSTTLHGVAGLPGNWEIRESNFAGYLRGIASAPGQLIAVGQDGAILKSDNVIEWTRVPYLASSGDFHCITFGKGLYVAGGTLGCLMAISPDGVNWTNIQSTTGIRANYGVAYGAGRFVVVGRGTPAPNCRIMTSTNGIDWEVPLRPTTNLLRAVTFGNGKYVAVGDHGTIITSSDATTWTVQISGTEHHLRSVIFTGWEFLAGGDSSSLLTSGDGISWSSVPFSSFDVRGLATCGTAVLAVGGLAGQGRVQASADGLSWTESVSALPAQLNALVQYDLGRFMAVGNAGLIIDSTTWADTPVNVWAKATDGYWDEAFWSLGHIPSYKDRSILITNAESKTLQIDDVTARDYPDSMHVRELILSARENSTNRLVLSNAGQAVQFQIDGRFRMLSNGVLIVANSALEAREFVMTGHAMFGENSRTVFREMIAGSGGPADILQSNATISVVRIIAGRGWPVTWQQHGGLTEAWVSDIGDYGIYVLHDGTHQIRDTLSLGGEYELRRGRLTATTITVSGRLRLMGGEISRANIWCTGGRIVADGNYELGTLNAFLPGSIDFQSSRTVLRFANSRGIDWYSWLTVENWTADLDKLFVGEDQTGLTPVQLGRIRFVNPGGFSPGIYSARITSTGEVVPVARLISYQRGGNSLVLTWPEGYRLLSATNVAGPYSFITNASSPYTASYTDPQRFFIIGNEN